MISKQTNSDLHGDIKNKQDSQDTVEDESACRELSQLGSVWWSQWR